MPDEDAGRVVIDVVGHSNERGGARRHYDQHRTGKKHTAACDRIEGAQTVAKPRPHMREILATRHISVPPFSSISSVLRHEDVELVFTGAVVCLARSHAMLVFDDRLSDRQRGRR